MWLQRKVLYSKVHDNQEPEISSSLPKTRGKDLRILGLLLFALISGGLGFYVSESLRATNTPGPRLDTNLETFVYNRSFSYPPSPSTDSAWRSLFPDGGSFFNHPTLPSTTSTISVLHQLHCLDGIRHGYWANNDAAVNGRKLIEEDLPPHLRSNHLRHCIDFLRQTLMCYGDTTFEIVNKELGGVSGFGTQHHCTNWEALKGWVSELVNKNPIE